MGMTTQHPDGCDFPSVSFELRTQAVTLVSLPAESEQPKVQEDGQGHAQDDAHHYLKQAPRANTPQRTTTFRSPELLRGQSTWGRRYASRSRSLSFSTTSRFSSFSAGSSDVSKREESSPFFPLGTSSPALASVSFLLRSSMSLKRFMPIQVPRSQGNGCFAQGSVGYSYGGPATSVIPDEENFKTAGTGHRSSLRLKLERLLAHEYPLQPTSF